MYNDKAPVPEEEYLIPFGQANVVREGRDITLVGTSSMVQVVCMAAAELLVAEGISAEVIDPRTIVPLDEATIIDIGAQDRPRASSSMRVTRASVSPPKSPRGSRRRPSIISTRRCGGWGRWMCRCRSRRRWRI